jgi:type I restriction enzyme S subunit
MSTKWPNLKAKYLLIRQKHLATDEDGIVTAFRDGEVVLRSERRTEGFTEAEKYIGYQGVKSGELVVHSMDAFAGAIGVAKSKGKMSPVVHIYSAGPEIDLRFYSYYLRHLANSGYIGSLAKGIRERSTSFDPAMLSQLEMPKPPIEVQRRIADYLDSQISILEKTIALKHQQLRCLKEESKELTLAWLTNMNKTGLGEWESMVGEHGLRAKIMFELRNTSEVDAPLASATMEGVILRETSANDVWNPEESTGAYKLVQPEDFVIGLRSFQHGFSYSEIRGKVSPAYTVFRLRKEFRKTLDPKYFSYLFQTRQFISLLEAISVGIREGRSIPFESFGNLLIPVPSASEISNIVKVQESNLEKITLLEKSLLPLAEMKSALVSAAVTQTLDVHELDVS